MERLWSLSDFLNEQLPSFHSIWRFSLLGSSTSWRESSESNSAESHCPNQVSCQSANSVAIDTCCVNHPSGHFLLTQFWDSSPPIGSHTSWTIHGLWPDYCKGGFDSFCDNKRSHSASQIRHVLEDAEASETEAYAELLNLMQKSWLSWDGDNANLWAHEWNKHGTCVSTLEPSCYRSNARQDTNNDMLDYFAHTVKLYSTLDTWGQLKAKGIEPSDEKTYSLSDLETAIQESEHGVAVTFKCHNHNELNEIWYHFTVRGSLRNASEAWSDRSKSKFVPTTPDGQISNCPKVGIRYLPKSSRTNRPSSTPTSTQGRTSSQPSSTSTPSSDPRPFSGRGHLKVRVLKDESQERTSMHSKATKSYTRGYVDREMDDHEHSGCLIRNGAWYATTSDSSCAIFSARDDVVHFEREENFEDSRQTILARQHYHLFTLSSSRAPCSFVSSSESTNSQPGQNGRLSCERELSYQSIFNAHIVGTDDEKGRSKVLAWSDQHQTAFYAEEEPSGHKQVQLWNTEYSKDGVKRPVRLQVHWQAYS